MKNKILSHLRSFSHVVNFRASRFYKAKSWDLLLPRQKQKRNPLNVICSQILSICSLQFLVGFIVPANLSSKENNCPIVALTGINGLWRKPKNNKAFRLLRGFKITMRKNLPKTLDQLIFCKYTLVFSKCSQIYLIFSKCSQIY